MCENASVEASSSNEEQIAPSSAPKGSHRVLMVAAFICAIMILPRRTITAALLLEDNYGWDVRWVGVAFGLPFCTSFITSRFFDQLNLNALVRIASLCPITGSLLMSRVLWSTTRWACLKPFKHVWKAPHGMERISRELHLE